MEVWRACQKVFGLSVDANFFCGSNGHRPAPGVSPMGCVVGMRRLTAQEMAKDCKTLLAAPGKYLHSVCTIMDKVYKTVAALGSAVTAFLMGKNTGDININSPTTVQNDCSTNVVVVEESVQKPVDEVDESGPSGGGQAKKKKPSSTKKNDSRKASLAQASKTKNKVDLSDIRAAQRTLRRQAKRKMESNGKLDKKIPKKKK